MSQTFVHYSVAATTQQVLPMTQTVGHEQTHVLIALSLLDAVV